MTLLDTPPINRAAVYSNGQLQTDTEAIDFSPATLDAALRDTKRQFDIVYRDGRYGVLSSGTALHANQDYIHIPELPPSRLGSPEFCSRHGVKLAYVAGAMANGIASEELIIALGRSGVLGVFGTAGLSLERVRAAIREVQAALPNGPYGFNLIHSPSRPAMEEALVDLYLGSGVRTIEASAFMALPRSVVRFRAAGLSTDSQGGTVIRNKVIAKLSHPHVAEIFLSPPPEDVLREMVEIGQITQSQARLAVHVPIADAVTIEGDSGGHTDQRPLGALFPVIAALRDRLARTGVSAHRVHIGAGGSLGDPSSIAAAFAMGADYVVTGSVNQACVEAGTSARVKEMLARADFTDAAMAPAADMFEMGVQVQVLKRETMFAVRAKKLYRLYQDYRTLEALPEADRRWLETEIFRMPCNQLWEQVCDYLRREEPETLERPIDPQRRLALMFRWYLGLSSKWAIDGVPGREMDYQVWCGPAMGAFNLWSKDTPFASPAGRRAAEVALALMQGAAYRLRIQSLRQQGVHFEIRDQTSAVTIANPSTVSVAASTEQTATLREPEAAKISAAAVPAVQAVRTPDEETIETWLIQRLAASLDEDEDEIDMDLPFASYAIDSAQAMAIITGLEKWLGRRLSPTLIYNYGTVRLLAQRLAEPD